MNTTQLTHATARAQGANRFGPLFLLFLLAASPIYGQVSFINPVQWGASLTNMAEQIKKAESMIQQGAQAYQLANTVARFAGNPSAGLRDLSQLRGIGAQLTRITGDPSLAKTFNDLAVSGDAILRMQNNGMSINSTFESGGKTYNRDVSLYEALAATGDLADRTRELVKTNEADERAAQARIDAEIARLAQVQADGSATQADIAAAALRIQREQAAAQARANLAAAQRALQDEERRLAEVRAGTATMSRLEKEQADLAAAAAARRAAAPPVTPAPPATPPAPKSYQGIDPFGRKP